jgi:hypothetical protein
MIKSWTAAAAASAASFTRCDRWGRRMVFVLMPSEQNEKAALAG